MARRSVRSSAAGDEGRAQGSSVPGTRAGDELSSVPEKKRRARRGAPYGPRLGSGSMVGGGGGGVAPWARGAPGDELSAVVAGDEGARRRRGGAACGGGN